MFDSFNVIAQDPAYLGIAAWVLCALAVNALVVLCFFAYAPPFRSRLVWTIFCSHAALALIVAAGALFTRLPNSGQVPLGFTYYADIARLVSYVAGVILSVSGWLIFNRKRRENNGPSERVNVGDSGTRVATGATGDNGAADGAAG